MAKKQKKMQQTWNELVGVAHIWTHEFKGKKGTYLSHSMSIGSKAPGDDEYTNYYFNIHFTKDCEIVPESEGDMWLEIEGFLAVDSYEDKRGNTVIKPKIVITQTATV